MSVLDLCRSVSSAAQQMVAATPTRSAPASMPAHLFRRAQAHKTLARYYQAAQDNRTTYGMASAPLSADSITQRTLRKLRARSRQEAAINDYCRKFLQLLDMNVVGPQGVTLRPQYKNSDGGLDMDAIRTVEEHWRQWGYLGSCDVTAGLSWRDVQRQTVRTTGVDGEVLLRIVIDPSPAGAPYHFRLEVVDPELLVVSDNRTLPNGNRVRQGIEYDAVGRPAAYWLLEVDPYTDYLGTGYHGRESVRVPAENILHVLDPESVGQRRGLPWTSTSLMRLAVLEGAEDAALIALRVGASKVGVFTREPGAQRYTGESGNKKTGETFVEAEPGTFYDLPPGVKLEGWDPSFPNGEFGPFIASALHGISSGLGVPYSSLSSDHSDDNYSTLRAVLLEAREHYKQLQEWLISRLIRPVFERWLFVQLASGSLVLPSGKALPLRKIEKFRQAEHQPRRWEGVDPLKEAQGQDIAIARGTMTESEAIRARGRDPEDVWLERQRGLARKKELGLPLGPEMAQLAPVVAESKEG